MAPPQQIAEHPQPTASTLPCACCFEGPPRRRGWCLNMKPFAERNLFSTRQGRLGGSCPAGAPWGMKAGGGSSAAPQVRAESGVGAICCPDGQCYHCACRVSAAAEPGRACPHTCRSLPALSGPAGPAVLGDNGAAEREDLTSARFLEQRGQQPDFVK